MQFHAFTLDIPQSAEAIPLNPPAINGLRDIQIPTLVIVGDQDVGEFIRLSDIVADCIPGAKRVIVPGAAHLPNMEEPELFNRIVLGFLSHV
jgi:pimeloyl-ACP methyl ester carboxylesterase